MRARCWRSIWAKQATWPWVELLLQKRTDGQMADIYVAVIPQSNFQMVRKIGKSENKSGVFHSASPSG